jgi:hypothetical protein
MVWVQVFPTGATLINQSVQQFNDNWLFLQNNINTDHYFDTGAPFEGHHRFSQYVNQAGDPGLLTDGAVYVKPNSTGGSIQPFFENAINVRQIPTCLNRGVIAGVANTTFSILNLLGTLTPVTGLVFVYKVGGISSVACGFVTYDGSGPTVGVISLGNFITAMGATPNNVTITLANNVGATANYQVMFLTLYP